MYAHYLFTYTCQIIHGNHGLSLELLCDYIVGTGTHDSLASWLFILKFHPLQILLQLRESIQFEPTKNDYNKIWNAGRNTTTTSFFLFLSFSARILLLSDDISLFFKILLEILFWKTLKSIKVVAKLLLELLRAVLHQKCIFWTSSFRAFFLQSSSRRSLL